MSLQQLNDATCTLNLWVGSLEETLGRVMLGFDVGRVENVPAPTEGFDHTDVTSSTANTLVDLAARLMTLHAELSRLEAVVLSAHDVKDPGLEAVQVERATGPTTGLRRPVGAAQEAARSAVAQAT